MPSSFKYENDLRLHAIVVVAVIQGPACRQKVNIFDAVFIADAGIARG